MKELKLKALGNRLIVKRIEKLTSSKIVIPDQYKDPSAYGVIVGLGTGVRNAHGKFTPFDVELGDTVRFGSLAGMDLEVDGETFRLLNYTDLLFKES